ncbi:methyltransferase family protein [Bradyrhizobium sp. STM 3557]|uniref:methyltransferase family protein n=1 Tax=Bradyrhizobium sp. STM 3557 TaxID=578920 RepID=UPI003890A52E
MNELVLLAGLMSYATMAVMVRRHFSATAWPRTARITRIISDVGVIAFAWLMWRDRHPPWSLAISLLLFLSAVALLYWATNATRPLRLHVAFDPVPPDTVMRSGPYRYIRHPFYTSYILFWLACAIATLHPLSVGFLVVVAAINLTAARREERAFAGSAFAAEYDDYRRTAGMFWPRFGALAGRY